MASRPPDLSSTNGGTGLEDLLVTPQELHRNSTLDDMDGLELFTDTLFWDLDLARFLDDVDYSRDVRDARGLRSNGSSNGSNSYGGSGLGGFEEEDFFNEVLHNFSSRPSRFPFYLCCPSTTYPHITYHSGAHPSNYLSLANRKSLHHNALAWNPSEPLQ
ncbi:hypothetical protein BDD12DRAFT_267702 [Trichophaea hybrida]|nr:hypothetical protein BDD12DRAFT_267702 [Trichophaea hybrida]